MDIFMTDKWLVKLFYSDTDSEQNSTATTRLRELFSTVVEVKKTEDEPLNSYFDQNGF
jgi:hypothetical protein